MIKIAKHTLETPISSNKVPNEETTTAISFENNLTTTQESPKISQTILDATSLSSQSSLSSASTNSVYTENTTSQEHIDNLIKQTNSLLNDDTINPEITELLKKLSASLIKTRNEANSFKIKSELLSISSKDADMRYEVENDLIKKEVESLKHQSENRDYLMNKINHQKQTLKKYKNEIINKNKEIIELTNKLNKITNDKKRKLFRSNTTLEQSNMLDTLGLLASQVLTEEEQHKNTIR